jgi:hypothetical protein
VGGNRHLVAESFFNPQTQTETDCSNLRYSGNNLLLDEFIKQTLTQNRLREFEAAMAGFDLEVGAPVPCTRDILRAYVGSYYYHVGGSPEAGKLEDLGMGSEEPLL